MSVKWPTFSILTRVLFTARSRRFARMENNSGDKMRASKSKALLSTLSINVQVALQTGLEIEVDNNSIMVSANFSAFSIRFNDADGNTSSSTPTSAIYCPSAAPPSISSDPYTCSIPTSCNPACTLPSNADGISAFDFNRLSFRPMDQRQASNIGMTTPRDDCFNFKITVHTMMWFVGPFSNLVV